MAINVCSMCDEYMNCTYVQSDTQYHCDLYNNPPKNCNECKATGILVCDFNEERIHCTILS
jgi:hypothetical protein